MGDASPDTASLEANGALVVEDEDRDRIAIWAGYDSYHPLQRHGELGWIRLVIDKRDGRILAWRRHQGNPLPFLAADEICARCGGNLDSRLRIDGHHPFFYYARRNKESLSIKLALARDPLFQAPVWIGHFDDPLDEEEVVEKFQAFKRDNSLYLIYESRHTTGLWRTGLRRYQADRLDSVVADVLHSLARN